MTRDIEYKNICNNNHSRFQAIDNDINKQEDTLTKPDSHLIPITEQSIVNINLDLNITNHRKVFIITITPALFLPCCLINTSKQSSSESEGDKSHGIVLFKEWFLPLLPPPSSRRNSLISQPSPPITSIVPTLLQYPSTRRIFFFSQPPPPTTSIVPPLLPPPSTRRNSLISHQTPLTLSRELLQLSEGSVIVLTDSPLASNYNNVFEDQIRSVYYPSNHITVFNNISNVYTADTHIGTIKIQRDICQYSFCFRPRFTPGHQQNIISYKQHPRLNNKISINEFFFQRDITIEINFFIIPIFCIAPQY